ncbi:MAG: chemotaxis protein methyltransferase CheR [Actinomycetota bacterium]|nr:chemotaxis protein methyltransferase CheR [Actinomycetota bacterium]
MTAGRRELRLVELRDETEDVEAIEVDLLLEAVYRHYKLDFRNYAKASLKRRLWRRAHEEGVGTLSALQEKVLHDSSCMERLLRDLSINVTSMYRDPSFYVAFRKKVVPMLRTYPFVRIWHAGCSTGEEVYSIAILLREEGLLDRTRIYATDVNADVLEQARNGVFPLGKMREYTENYISAGGTSSFSDYYVTAYEGARFNQSLMENTVFAQHNLVSDASFNEFNVIMCRNVMIYFSKPLQDHVHDLFYKSLGMFGVLALGHKESIKFTLHESDYDVVDAGEKLYRRIA